MVKAKSYFPKVAFRQLEFDGFFEEAEVIVGGILLGHTCEGPPYYNQPSICIFRPTFSAYRFNEADKFGLVQPYPYEPIKAEDTQALQHHIRRLLRRG